MASIRLLLVGMVCLTGCRPTGSTAPPPVATTAPTPAPISTNVAGLRRLINVPRKPIAVKWQQTQIGDGTLGPSDSQLLAVLEYSPADVDFVERVARQKLATGSTPPQIQLDVPTWFPDQLQQKAATGANGSKVLLAEKLETKTFAKLSLQNGFAVRVPKSSYIVVSLFTT